MALIDSELFNSGEFEPRSFDGTNNNPNNPELGAEGEPLIAIAPLAFGDGFSTPGGADRVNPRIISNALSNQDGDIPSPQGLTQWLTFFGQFLDHDLGLTPDNGTNDISIPVPPGDPDLDPLGTGTSVILQSDSVFIEGTGTDLGNPRLFPNEITAFLDGSNIYGSDRERAEFLRSFEGGRLRTSEGNLLPFGEEGVANDNPFGADPTSLFIAGDVRANENIVLTSVHTLFVREHNRIAEEISAANPELDDEEIFERARAINIAQYQSIIYNEYLPALLGGGVIPEYTGYDPNVDPSISRTFSTAAYRLGHTQLSSSVPALDTNGVVVPEGDLSLADLFFAPAAISELGGVDPVIRGIASTISQSIDTSVITDVRSLLFGFGPTNETGTTAGRDLVAINIQRGRVAGLADYNTIRESFGLPRVNSFAEISSNPDVQNALASVYDSVNNIDAFIGLLAEDQVPGSALGTTLRVIVADQFTRARDGDRFYYENIFSPEEVAEIETTTLAGIIRDNTDTSVIQDNAFSLVNNGTDFADVLRGGLGSDTINGGNDNDLINGFQDRDFLFGGLGDDILIGFSGGDILDGGVGNDLYQIDALTGAGGQINDAGGSDTLLITTNLTVDNLPSIGLNPGSDIDLFDISLSGDDDDDGTLALGRDGTNLVIDIDQNGIFAIESDITINNFFSSAGAAPGIGFVEQINNIGGSSILSFFGGDDDDFEFGDD